MDKNLKETIENVKNIYKNSNSTDDLLKTLENTYERISNRPDKNYDVVYDVMDIFNGDTLKTLKFVANKKPKKVIIFEFVKTKKLEKIVIIYNEMNDKMQTKIEIYI